MRTLLTEVEATVNSRPLTYISESPEELSVLSPAHFLLGSQTMKIPDALKVDSSNRNEILQNWKARQEAANKFWRKWSEEYLQQLRSAHHRSPTNSSNFKINDVVLLHDQNASRLLWKLAKIVQLFPGRDGKIRACEIQLANGLRTRRPIQLLYPLEVDSPPGEDVKILPHDPEPCSGKQLRAQKHREEE